MKIYKFKDNVDGGFILILSDTLESAVDKVGELTSLETTYIGSKSVSEIPHPIIIKNTIAPF